MTGNEFIKYITKKLVIYLEMTKSEKVERKSKRSEDHSSSAWFGVLPMSFKLIMRKD